MDVPGSQAVIGGWCWAGSATCTSQQQGALAHQEFGLQSPRTAEATQKKPVLNKTGKLSLDFGSVGGHLEVHF